MKNETLFFAFCYEVAIRLIERFPRLRFSPWLKMLLAYCKEPWVEWKTETTLQAVDKQAKGLVEQWNKEERQARSEALAAKAHQLYPDAKVTPVPDAPVPSVMIIREAAPNASEEVKALGGEMRITYRLE
jgi:hypothetical protein